MGRYPKDKDTSLIPPGMYCYTFVDTFPGGIKIKECPYWSRNKDKDYQESGYCSYLEKGDWDEDGPFLLWDQCKLCDINKERKLKELKEKGV